MLHRSSAAAKCLFITSLLLTCATARPDELAASRPSDDFSSTTTPEDQAVEEQLNKKLPSVQLPGTKFSDAIDFLHDVTGLNIYIDWKSLQLAGVTPDLRIDVERHDIPIRDTLQQILSTTGSDALEFHPIDGVVVISTRLDFRDRQHQTGPFLSIFSDDKSAAFLKKHLPSVQLPTVSLSDAIDFLRDITGQDFWMNWKALEAAGIPKSTPVSITLHDARVSTVLNLLLDQIAEGKLGYTAQSGPVQTFDKKHRPITVDKVLITISTIDDLMATAKSPTTKPG